MLYWEQKGANKMLLAIQGVQKMEKVNIGANTSLAAPWALAHRLQRRTACNT